MTAATDAGAPETAAPPTEGAGDGPPLSRAGLRRAAALVPDGERRRLVPLLMRPEIIAPLEPARAIERLMAYLLDPLGRAILGVDDELAAWLAGSPLLRPCGPGAAAPLGDDLAAALVAPMLARQDELPAVLWKWRWSPRADELIAATVAELSPAAGQAALGTLLAPGPDEDRVHQAALQAGRALALCPHLHDTAEATAVVDALVPLLNRGTPRPLLVLAVDALGPIGRARTELGERVRFHGMSQLGAAVDRIITPTKAPTGFAAELAALDTPAGDPAFERARRMPDWEVAEHCAHLLGAAAPDEPEAFVGWRQTCIGLFADLPLLPAFLDGLVTAAAVGPVSDMVVALATGDDDDRAMAADLSTMLPVDGARSALLALLEDQRPGVRVSALQGLALIGDVDAISARLGDPTPEVAAAAALALVELGHGAACLAHRPDDPSRPRWAAIRAAAGAADTETVGELAVELMRQLDDAGDTDDLEDSPLLLALRTALFTTPAGLGRAAALLGGVPASLPVVALAAPRDDDQNPGVLAPPDGLAALAESLGDALDHDDETGALGFTVLAGLSCGDTALAARIAARLAATEGFAGQLLFALAELRVRSVEGAAALAPLLAATQPLPGRVLAAAAAGRILPLDHPAWSDVAALLELGTFARAAAWASLRDRVRFPPI